MTGRCGPLLAWLLCGAVFCAAASSTPKELGRAADAGQCKNLGFPSTKKYQQVVPLRDGTNVAFLPIYSDQGPLASVHASVKTAIVFFTGAGAHANLYFCMAAAATADETKGSNSVITVVPWFGNEQVNISYWQPKGSGLPQSTGSVYWTSSSKWLGGEAGSILANGTSSYSKPLSSFGTVESLVSMLLNKTNFPHLDMITFAGFSAGGQVTQRLAWVSPWGIPHLSKALPSAAHVTFRFLPCSPGSYTYLSPHRPAPECSPRHDTGRYWVCNNFTVPEGVKNYNDWKYGTVLKTTDGPYMMSLDGLQTNLTKAYLKKQIVYVAGAQDACNCQTKNYTDSDFCFPASTTCTPTLWSGCCDTYPDGTTNQLDVSSSGMLEGSNRLQRALNFANSLRVLFPRSTLPRVAVVPGMGHNASAFLASKVYRRYAFRKWYWGVPVRPLNGTA